MGSSVKALNAYLRKCAGRKFEWGVHDCFTFTNGAFAAMYGAGWADDWLGRYMIDGRPMRRDELRKEFGYSTLTQAIDQRLQRVSYIPPRGSLVTYDGGRKWVTGAAFGISVGMRAAFLDREGVIYIPIELTQKRWVKNETQFAV